MARGTRLALTVALVALAACAPAAAAANRSSVTVTRATVTVASHGASVVVNRSPFGIRFVSAPGTTVLKEVPNRNPGPSMLPSTMDPIAPGIEPARSGQLYAPLSFLVGTDSITQYEGGVWGGNLQSGVHSGVQYSARKVVAVRRGGGGVVLTVSTDDPSGRKLTVAIAPDGTGGSGAFRVTVTPHPSAGVVIMSDSFASTPSEGFYGFGGRHNALNQHGQVLASWVQEENLPGLGKAGTPDGILFPNGPTAAYYAQAQFISSRGYGFLLNQSQLSWFRLDSDRPNAWSVAVAAPSLDYVVAPGGTPAKAVGSLTALSGRQPAPPAWALGPMLDRLVKNTGETEADYEAELSDDLANLRKYRMPLTAYRIEGWGFSNPGNDGLSLHTFVSFADQQKIVSELRARHIHPLAYLRPWITPGSAPDRAGLTVKTATGQTYVTTGTSGQRIALLDFTNPAAVKYWKHVVANTLNLGFDGFMADFGEEVLSDMHFHDGQTGATMHNEYPVLYMKATREAVDAYMRAHPGRQIWFFNRAGYSGTPGSAAYEGGNFPGDEATNWGAASGLASLTPDMLNRAVGGAYGYGTDIGGYYDYTTPPTTKSLFLRWAEWAALSPVFRLHGSGRAGTHTPWSYDQQTVNTYRALSKLHEHAEPLIMRLWKQADRTGIPPTRPLWLEFPGDRRAAGQTQEWMLGDDVLVAPVVTEGATSRPVYFPAGCWRDPQTRLTVRAGRGGRSRPVRAPLTELPYFVKCGTDPLGQAG